MNEFKEEKYKDPRKGLDKRVRVDGGPSSNVQSALVDKGLDIPPMDTFVNKTEWVQQHKA